MKWILRQFPCSMPGYCICLWSNSFDGDGLPALKKQLREFTLNTQQALEEERAELLSKNAMLEQEVEELHDYINTHLSR